MNPDVKYEFFKVPDYVIFAVKRDKRMLHVLTFLPLVVIIIIRKALP